MLFNSFAFAVFFPIVFMAYWRLPLRLQNVLLLLSSYFFYGWWDWRFLFLLAAISIVDYTAGINAERRRGPESSKERLQRKAWVCVSVAVNLGVLCFFKYFNFFADGFEKLLHSIGIFPSSAHLNLILPIGISFLTFRSMSYSIDVYRQRTAACRSLLNYALFVSFFPLLLAGPIERAEVLLPQLARRRIFSRVQIFDGLHLIFWGLFKKIYVADNLKPFVDRIFSLTDPSGIETMAACYAFSFQIYCDFSGYSDIAMGCVKCLGMELNLNFNHPYISTNPSEFWRRWHISLSSWLRDYLYIPLGGNRAGKIKIYRNLALTMLLGGLWHGAAWNYVLWGGYHGVLLVVYRLVEPLMGAMSRFQARFGGLFKILSVLLTFHLVCVGWLIFRAESLTQIVTMSRAAIAMTGKVDFELFFPLIYFVFPLMLVETVQFISSRLSPTRLDPIRFWLRPMFYGISFYLLAFHGASAQSFIYFQF